MSKPTREEKETEASMVESLKARDMKDKCNEGKS